MRDVLIPLCLIAAILLIPWIERWIDRRIIRRREAKLRLIAKETHDDHE